MPRPRIHAESRGLDEALQSHFLQGRFGRLFRSPTVAAKFAATEEETLKILKDLAAKMVAPAEPKDGLIPAGYTYLGQFIDHDLTFDPVSSLQRENDPASIVDYRTPRFDLDCLYGRGPQDQPYLYWDDGIRMRMGRRLNNGKDLGNNIKQDLGYDLPRPEQRNPRRRNPSAEDSEKAIIGDPRNDENIIIAQLHAVFMQFHNRVADKLEDEAGVAPAFAKVQQEVRWHYQWVVLYDFLPRIIDPDIYGQVLPHVTKEKQKALHPPLIPQSVLDRKPDLRHYKPEEEAFMPVEFSGAAYRFGHSMVRDKYRLNTNKDPGIGGPLAILSDDRAMNLQGFRNFRPGWGIEWGLFFDGFELKDFNEKYPQRALTIDTSLAKPLAELPSTFVTDNVLSLPERNLVRGWRLHLPSGQAVAERLGEKPLSDDQLKLPPALSKNAPLWYYILSEAENSKTGTLGRVGSQIVMETFVGLMWEDRYSFLRQHPNWTPDKQPFGMTEFIKFAQSEQ